MIMMYVVIVYACYAAVALGVLENSFLAWFV